MKKGNIAGLIKLGNEEFMRDLFYNGTLYMNTIEYFRNGTGDENRDDPYESIFSLKQIVSTTMIDLCNNQVFRLSRDGGKDGQLVKGHLLEYNDNLNGNIFCMYGFTPNWLKENTRIDAKNINFGDGRPSMVVITNLSEFKKRVESKLNEDGLSYAVGMVRYYDEDLDHEGLGVFHKRNCFRHQSEFRIHVKHKVGMKYNEKGALSIEIGSLHDIAQIHDASNLPDIKIHILDSPIQNGNVTRNNPVIMRY